MGGDGCKWIQKERKGKKEREREIIKDDREGEKEREKVIDC